VSLDESRLKVALTPTRGTSVRNLMDRQQWHAEVFAQDNGFEPYTHFIDELDDFQFTALDAAIENALAVRGIDLVSTEWLKPLGQGLHEFRVRHAEDEILHMFGAGEIGAST
jgi:hypothetical protein